MSDNARDPADVERDRLRESTSAPPGVAEAQEVAMSGFLICCACGDPTTPGCFIHGTIGKAKWDELATEVERLTRERDDERATRIATDRVVAESEAYGRALGRALNMLAAEFEAEAVDCQAELDENGVAGDTCSICRELLMPWAERARAALASPGTEGSGT